MIHYYFLDDKPPKDRIYARPSHDNLHCYISRNDEKSSKRMLEDALRGASFFGCSRVIISPSMEKSSDVCLQVLQRKGIEVTVDNFQTVYQNSGFFRSVLDMFISLQNDDEDDNNFINEPTHIDTIPYPVINAIEAAVMKFGREYHYFNEDEGEWWDDVVGADCVALYRMFDVNPFPLLSANETAVLVKERWECIADNLDELAQRLQTRIFCTVPPSYVEGMQDDE